MNRRDTIQSLLGLLGASAFPIHAQTPTPRVSILMSARVPATDPRIVAFHEGMKALGYRDGGNVSIDLHSADFSRDEADRLASELVARKPAVLVTQGYATRALATRTKTIPIVCASSGDLADLGLIKSLAHPGGNLTGVQLMSLDLAGKRIEMLKELMPGLRRLAVIADPGHAGEHRERDVSIKAAQRLGIAVSYHPVRNFEEYDAVLANARASGAEALVLFPDSITNRRTRETAAFALQHKLATVGGWDNYAEAGQLVTYGPNLRATWGRLAYYVDRILKGARPADLPVELPMVFELVVNAKTAKALGLKIPQIILVRADRIIE